jgi:hypothetical protein
MGQGAYPTLLRGAVLMMMHPASRNTIVSTNETSWQGSLSPEEEERARTERAARRATASQQPVLGLAGNEDASAASPVADSLANNATSALHALQDSPGSTVDFASSLAQGVGHGLMRAAARATSSLGAATSQLTDLASATVSSAADHGASVQAFVDGASNLAGAAVNVAGAVATNAADLAEPLLRAGAGIVATAGGAVTSLDISGAADAADSLASVAAETAGQLANAAIDVAGNIPAGEILGAIASSGELLEPLGEVAGAVLGAVIEGIGDSLS